MLWKIETLMPRLDGPRQSAGTSINFESITSGRLFLGMRGRDLGILNLNRFERPPAHYTPPRQISQTTKDGNTIGRSDPAYPSPEGAGVRDKVPEGSGLLQIGTSTEELTAPAEQSDHPQLLKRSAENCEQKAPLVG